MAPARNDPSGHSEARLPVQTIRDLSELRAWRASVNGTVALVPTMGALHDGHMALVAEARAKADHVVASIFVNPMQFGPNEDLSRYPRREAADATLLKDAGVAVLWAPDVATMYPDGFATTVSVAKLSDGLDGAARPGHFDGVATIVSKLFNQVRPDIAVFGEKDWQQLAIVRRMTIDLDLGVEVIGMQTQRDADGLALSSRNIYLSEEERLNARTLEKAGFVVDYVELVGPDLRSTNESLAGGRLLAAAKIGTTRLIDNLPLA